MKYPCENKACEAFFTYPEALEMHQILGCVDVLPRELRAAKSDVTEQDRKRFAKLVPAYIKVGWLSDAVSFTDVDFPGVRGAFASFIYKEDGDRILPQFINAALFRRKIQDRVNRMGAEE